MIAPVILILLAFHPVTTLTVTGKVTDDKGNPVTSAVVVIAGTRTGTVCTADGNYSITVATGNETLSFSAVGYKEKRIKINGKTVINVTLEAQEMALQEVVVIGYSSRSMKPREYSAAEMLAATPAPGYSGTDSDSAGFDTEDYDNIKENRFLRVNDNPLSTFSIDVDAASYSNVRRFIEERQLPPAGAVRIEEMINYFRYDYLQPKSDQPFSINTEISDAPWNKDHKLVLIGLQGKKIPTEQLPPSNLVFLIDVSGSMNEPNKLPLVKESMKLLVDQLRGDDRVAIVVYAGAAGLVLEPTNGDEKDEIKEAIDHLEAGGSTAGGAGLKLAYKTARENFERGGNNRVILCTDGDFNVGESSDDAMERLIEQERKSGVFLTVLGFGMGNYKDNKMQKLADKGNGNHAYIDGMGEAKKVLVNEFGGTLFTIAKDVKLQVEFNPAKVQGYRLIGYENRMLAKEDFNDDKKDAGELGSGHTVTALYEIIPAGIVDTFLAKPDTLKYSHSVTERLSPSSYINEIMTVKFRYKKPDEEISKLIEHSVIDNQIPLPKTSDNFRFAAAVAEFGMLLRHSEFKSNASMDQVFDIARKAKGSDEEGYRAEFIRMVKKADALAINTKKESGNGVAKTAAAENH